MRVRQRISWVLASVVALALLLPGTGAIAQEATPVAETELLDLAAMTLTPDDLADAGFAGYLVADGRSQTLEDRVADQEATDGDGEATRKTLTDLGWIRNYRNRLAHADETGNEDFDALISSGVTQFADERGASEGWNSASLSDVAATEASFVEDAEEIGDESRLINLAPIQFDDGEDHPAMRLLFRSGTLLGDLIVVGVPGETVDQATVEELAARLLERMDAVVKDGGPNLSLLVLRWQGISVADPDLDNYLKLDGAAYIGLGDTEQDIDQDEVDYADATDRYRYEAALTRTLVQYTSIAQFPDEDLAQEWVAGAYARTDANRTADVTLEKVTGVPTFGDESVVMKVVLPVEDGEATGYAVFAQIGDQAFSFALISLEGLETDDVIAMAQDQLACFEAGDCTDSVPLPDWAS